MSAYHRIGRLQAPAQPRNPYLDLDLVKIATPMPSMTADEWASAPGIRPQPAPGIGNYMWKNKGSVAGDLAGWSAGAALGAKGGAALGTFIAPGVGTAIGGAIGGIGGGIVGGLGGGWLGGKADTAMNGDPTKQPGYRPPVTDLASYGANMLAQGIEENRQRKPIT